MIRVLIGRSVFMKEESISPRGMTVINVAGQIGYNAKTAQTYIPAVRPYYNINPSDNARKIKRCREKKMMQGERFKI